MIRDLSRLIRIEHDVVVIGGGIHGLATAYDAAQRGLSVALVERADFGGATSFSHLKTIHGGLRYLQSADFSRMRESIGERRTFARIAPHLVRPLGFVMPTYAKLTRSRLAMSVAFMVDALVAADRNAGLAPQHRLQAGHVVSRDECVKVFGGAAPAGATGGALWYDYQMTHADRLTLAFALAADARGAALANYVEAVEPLRDGAGVRGVRVRDLVKNETLEVRGRLVVNMAGPWAADLLDRWAVSRSWPMLRAINVVANRPAGPVGLVAPTRQGRALVLVPWYGRVVVGTGESPHVCAAADQAVTADEMAAFVGEANEAFPALQLEPHDVTLVHRGVVPAATRNGRLMLLGHSEIRDHAHEGVSGLVSIVGVKYTTARLVAEKTVDLALTKLGRAPIRCRTATELLPGGEPRDVEAAARDLSRSTSGLADAEVARRLVEMYGTSARGVTDLAAADASLAGRVVPSQPLLRAEIIHAVRTEMARTLVDVVVRRTALGAAGHPGTEAARACAELLKTELGWSDDQTARELNALSEFYAPVRP
jgi:glycerol-3-phosphate dehydrogenase